MEGRKVGMGGVRVAGGGGLSSKFVVCREEQISLVYNDLIRGLRYFEFYCRATKTHGASLL